MSELKEINEKLDKIINILIGQQTEQVIFPRRRDPNFRKELQQHMDEHRMNQSDLARQMFGKDKHGKARGRDRISVWLAGKSYPTKKNYQKILDIFNLV
jgi:hypothetical protein